MRWLKRKRERELSVLDGILETSRAILEILPIERGETAATIHSFRVPAEEMEGYAVQLDKALGIRGEKLSGGGSSWMTWKKGKVEVTIFVKGGLI